MRVIFTIFLIVAYDEYSVHRAPRPSRLWRESGQAPAGSQRQYEIFLGTGQAPAGNARRPSLHARFRLSGRPRRLANRGFAVFRSASHAGVSPARAGRLSGLIVPRCDPVAGFRTCISNGVDSETPGMFVRTFGPVFVQS